MTMAYRRWAFLAAAVLLGCGDDGGGPAGDTEGDSESGFTGLATGNATGGSSGVTETGTATDAGTESSSDTQGSGYDTLGEGDVRGILTFTLYPADAITNEDIVGMAGAYRDIADNPDHDFSTIDDFFALWGLSTAFPPPPAEEDGLQHDGLLPDFDWGAPTDWLLAGNAMKLRLPDSAAHACLLYRGGSPQVAFPPGSDMMVPNYPIYASSYSSLQPEGCSPEAATWLPDTEYDLVLYGGELFEDNSLTGQVHTPPVFEITAPNFDEYQRPVDSMVDLEIAWSGEGNPDNRIVIRVWDMFGRTFSIHADDDGSYVIPAADLQMLELGPITVTVARENIENVPFTDGVVKVTTRYEVWGYFDLY